MRRGFTLIELLVIIGIMGLMVTVGIVSVRTGKGAARVKGATRDIFAAIRHARSTALVTQQPAIITYSTVEEDGEVVAKIEITATRLFAGEVDRSKLDTLTGFPAKWQERRAREERELVHIRGENEQGTKAKKGQELVHIRGKDGQESESDISADVAENGSGDTLEDILFEPINTDIVKGMRVKVEMGDKFDVTTTEEVRKPKISVFSNVDYLLGRYKEKQAKAAAMDDKSREKEDAKSKDGVATDKQEPVSVVWETNGRVDPHMVWIYADGQKPEDGLLIKIDRFGAAKVLNGDGKETE